MKDYTLIVDTLNTAETLLKDYTAQTELEIKSKSANITTQIAEYIHQVLINADFPNAGFIVSGAFKDHVCPEMILKTGNYFGGYKALVLVEGKKINHFGIYFKEDGYRFNGDPEDKELALYLCELWPLFKRKLPHEIDKALEYRNKRIKEKTEELNRERAIIESFQL